MGALAELDPSREHDRVCGGSGGDGGSPVPGGAAGTGRRARATDTHRFRAVSNAAAANHGGATSTVAEQQDHPKAEEEAESKTGKTTARG
jgi:hypothetical protein